MCAPPNRTAVTHVPCSWSVNHIAWLLFGGKEGPAVRAAPSYPWKTSERKQHHNKIPPFRVTRFHRTACVQAHTRACGCMCESWCGWCTGSSDRCAERSQCASPCCPSSSTAPPLWAQGTQSPTSSLKGGLLVHVWVTSSFFTRWWAQILSDSQVSQILRMSPDKKCRAQKKVHHMHSPHTHIHTTNTHTHAHTHHTHSTHTTHIHTINMPQSHHTQTHHAHTTHYIHTTHTTQHAHSHITSHTANTHLCLQWRILKHQTQCLTAKKEESPVIFWMSQLGALNTLPYEQSAISLPWLMPTVQLGSRQMAWETDNTTPKQTNKTLHFNRKYILNKLPTHNHLENSYNKYLTGRLGTWVTLQFGESLYSQWRFSLPRHMRKW